MALRPLLRPRWLVVPAEPLRIEPFPPSFCDAVSWPAGRLLSLSAAEGDGESMGDGSSWRREMSVAWESLWCRLCPPGVSMALARRWGSPRGNTSSCGLTRCDSMLLLATWNRAPTLIPDRISYIAAWGIWRLVACAAPVAWSR